MRKKKLPTTYNILFSDFDNNKTLLDKPWTAIFEPLEKIGSKLSYSWRVTSHLNVVRNSKELRTANDKVRIM